MVWTCSFICHMNELSSILCKILWCYHFCYDFIHFEYIGYTRTRIRSCGYPNLRVVVILGCFRIIIFITRTFKNPNYPTQTLRVTGTPRASGVHVPVAEKRADTTSSKGPSRDPWILADPEVPIPNSIIHMFGFASFGSSVRRQVGIWNLVTNWLIVSHVISIL